MTTKTKITKVAVSSLALASTALAETNLSQVRYGTEKVEDLDIFYREAGDPSKQAVVLLHGFPTSSHMYREVLAELGDEFYLIAPDYPGFGNSSFPSGDDYTYSFDNIAESIDQFLVQRKVTDYVLMIQDYGAPVGYRIALKHPEKVKGFVVMNGNAYEEGLSQEGWGVIFDYWKNKTPELEAQIASHVFTLEGLKWQYTHGTRNPDDILPDNWNLDFMKFERPGQHRVQLDLFYDYQNNLTHYPAWQKFLRDTQPPMLIVWGKNDAFFPASGAEAYKLDVKDIDFNLLDTGHFALEEEAPFITSKMRTFLREKIK
ncbi:alpha/beta hydrolase [Rubellicoccus peritrichatus]|uniref:Alpha/beta hydrolase n=1 Tax=Rubellicoccus peritrichatus TaxID=3080537 RepID=A0AAQ3L811_9BACT|nr:alpha/beta hydrolase [Puniceicoccus sp. CR14]WOO40985.1 alpha/beta hydrolase [Puniceicoccus sp. CR14]